MSVPAPFDYHIATTVNKAIALLQQYGTDAKVLAGGHSLIPGPELRKRPRSRKVDKYGTVFGRR